MRHSKRKFILLVLFILVIPAQLMAATPDCRNMPERRQFDFWIGEWDVLHEGQKAADSSIQDIVNGCIVFENYAQADGYSGKSLNFYDPHIRKWRQAWVDAKGMVSEFSGEYREDAMRLEGESHYPDGTKALRRLTFFKLGPDRVRQYSEISKDGGKTWSPHYDLLYVRKK